MKLHIAKAATGLLWIRLGVRTFWRQPLGLAGVFFLFMAGVSLLTWVPVIGLPLAMVALPGLTLGLMVATREADEGRFPRPLILLSAFRRGSGQTRAMALLGICYAAGFLAAVGLSWLVDGGGFARVYLGGTLPDAQAAANSRFQLAMLVFLLVHLPVSLMFWHAPALVHWHDMPALKSVFFSMVACMRNLRALLLFALGWMLAMLLTLMAVALLAAVPGLSLLGHLFLPVMLMLAAMFFCSLYYTYRDTFRTERASDAAQRPPQETP